MVLLAMASNGIPPPVLGPATVPPDYMENGRLYHGYHRGAYMLPCDEDEKDRLDIYHKFFSVARKEQLHSAPFTPNYDGPRILDLGCGTGIWAIDMADTYTQAEVLGVDLSLIQPAHIPENLRFSRRDIESPWHGIGEGSWDMIHIRMLAGSIADWRDLYWKVFRHLKPNFGWMEQVEIDFTPRCDDSSLPANSPLYAWGQYLAQATARAEKPMAVDPNTRTILQQLGFVDVSEQVIRVPMNPWPTEPHQKDIGRWYNLGLVQGLEALSLAPLTRVNHWSKEDVDRLITEVKKDICTKKFHVYCNMHIWTARRPN